MKLKNETFTVESKNPIETHKFGISGDIARMFKMIAVDIYADPVMAVIRENSTNAQDSHRQAGHNDPIKVHIPTQFEPYFEVEDRGIGIDPDRFGEVYCTAGLSQKTDTDTLTGGLGVGCKSAFAIADAFTVRLRYNGTECNFIAQMGADGIPEYSKLSEQPTQEPNGVCIRIEVDSQFSNFRAKCLEVYRHFKVTPEFNDPNMVADIAHYKANLVNKGVISSVNGDGQPQDYQFELGTNWDVAKVVMGDNTYTVPNHFDNIGLNGYIEMPVGSISFDNGRERIADTQENKEVYREHATKVATELSKVTLALIEAEPTEFKKKLKYRELNTDRMVSVLRESEIDFKKYEIPQLKEGITYFKKMGAKCRTRKKSMFSFDTSPNTEYYRFVDRMGGRISNYVRETGKTVVILTDEAIATWGIDDDLILDLTDLPKPERSSTGVYKTTNKCKVFKYNGRQYSGADSESNWDDHDLEVDTDDEVLYVEISRYKPVLNDISDLHKVKNELAKLDIDVEVIGLKTAFLRQKKAEALNLKCFWEFAKEKIEPTLPKKLEKHEFGYRFRYAITEINQQTGKFEEIMDAINDAKTHDRIQSLWNILNIDKTELNDHTDKLQKQVYKDYPLFDDLEYYTNDLIYYLELEEIKQKHLDLTKSEV